VEIFDTALEVIDMRSFSNLWFWIALAVLWSSTSYWVLGVPFEMIQRARREGGQARADMEDLVRINVTRFLHMVESGSLMVVGLGSFWLSALAILGFGYGVEFAQAVFLLLSPMVLVVWFSIRSGRRILGGENTGDALHHRLMVHRRIVQAIGIVSITVTALYGTWQNLNISILH